MFRIFKSKLDTLQDSYKKTLEQCNKVPSLNKNERDAKQLEAQKILEQIEILQQH